MIRAHLTSRITAVLISISLFFVLALAISVSSLALRLDQQAADDALALVTYDTEHLLSHLGEIQLEYARWDEAADRAEAQDKDWLFQNFTIGASFGQIMQLEVIWGGSFPEAFGWTDNGDTAPQSGLLDSGLLRQIDRRLADIPLGAHEGIQFFAWHEGSLFAMAASRIEHSSPLPGVSREENYARLLMGQRVSESQLRDVVDHGHLSRFEILSQPPRIRMALPLLGIDDMPVAYLAWERPRPGTAMLRQMAPGLIVLALLVVGLALLGASSVRQGARTLMRTEQEARTAARTDALTGLPNRLAFQEALQVPAQAGERALIVLNVNGFKRVNDSIGHANGDQVLQTLAWRLAELSGPDCFLARISGDEFVFVVTSPRAEHRVVELTDAVEQQLVLPLRVQDYQLHVTASLGYVVQSSTGMSGEDLVRQADLAKYEAKRRRSGRAVPYSSVLNRAGTDAGVIEHGLRNALARPGELSVAYQPIVGQDGRMVRAEALARWTSPELGQVPPDRFIAVAEQAGLIVALGRQILRRVLQDMASQPDLNVSLNISPLQLLAPDFVAMLTGEVGAFRIDPGRIEVELTEAVIVDDSDLAVRRLGELRAARFSVALDDFGTGYSSIGYLRTLKFETLKIDRSVLADVHRTAGGLAVLEGIIAMAHGLELSVVCEGVETDRDLHLLRHLKCDLLQGYFFDKPLPISDLAARWLPAGASDPLVAGAPRRLRQHGSS